MSDLPFSEKKNHIFQQIIICATDLKNELTLSRSTIKKVMRACFIHLQKNGIEERLRQFEIL